MPVTTLLLQRFFFMIKTRLTNKTSCFLRNNHIVKNWLFSNSHYLNLSFKVHENTLPNAHFYWSTQLEIHKMAICYHLNHQSLSDLTENSPIPTHLSTIPYHKTTTNQGGKDYYMLLKPADCIILNCYSCKFRGW